jgi:hypothetical protein
MQEIVHEKRYAMSENCVSVKVQAWDEFDEVEIDSAISQWRARHCACAIAEGGHFEHTL